MTLSQRWPGKSDDTGATHPALWHMLDVAAVALALMPDGPLRRLTDVQQNAILFLIALHDLGKISTTFRRQITENHSPHDYARHWRLSAFLLWHHDAILEPLLGADEYVRAHLCNAVAGHHGRPPAKNDKVAQRKDSYIGADGLADSATAITALAPLFQPMSLGGLIDGPARELSWLVSGLTVQADWVGSNTTWFPFSRPDLSIDAYWAKARSQVPTALQQAGLAQARATDVASASLITGNLRPMQAAVADVALPDGPTLALIEDATGAGKTEAALILAHRMIRAGKGRGLYFALPTTATADAIFARLRPMLRRMFDGRPSLSLAHGRRMLSNEFAEVVGNLGQDPLDAGCSDWLADDRRLSLLAEIGVGTIDQALMAVLPTRFNTLRMAALADRIIVVDEAHSYDPYVETELRGLLRFQAMLGGSAIVMTATLPRPMRAGLVKAFRDGLPMADRGGLSDAYPTLAVVGRTTQSVAVAPVLATCRRVTAHRLPDVAAAVATIVAGANNGAACLWVRNAVDDAIAAVGLLRDAGVPAVLLHARFATCDRLLAEARMIARFGRDGVDRAGRVLVATQVVESSLDLDLDLMVSDLAPIGALIQRAGRLWRHMDLRPAATRPVAGPALHVLSPDPLIVENTRWLHQVLDAGAWVYPQDVQWRSARALFAAGGIDAPEGLRALIGAVHGDDPLPVPDVLTRVELESEGMYFAQAGQARLNLLNPTYAFADMEQVYDDKVYPTRLAEKQQTLVLTRRSNTGLVPWAGTDMAPARALTLSEVQLSLKKYHATTLAAQQASAEVAAFTARWKDWERATKAVAVVGDDGKIAGGLRYDVLNGLSVLNDAEQGPRTQKSLYQ